MTIKNTTKKTLLATSLLLAFASTAGATCWTTECAAAAENMVFSIPAFAQEHAGHHPASMHLKPIQAEYVCMINNRAFDKPQIPTEVDGKTYYGCCAMCKGKLEKSAAARTAKDPVSGKDVDKATAIIGAAEDGTVYYFETEENMHAFTPASDDHHAEHNDESMPDMQH